MLSRLTLLSAGLLATSLSAATFDDVHPAANPNDSTYLSPASPPTVPWPWATSTSATARPSASSAA